MNKLLLIKIIYILLLFLSKNPPNHQPSSSYSRRLQLKIVRWKVKEMKKKKNLMKIWSSGRRSDEQQVIIRTKTLFVDVILAFHLQSRSRLYFSYFSLSPKKKKIKKTAVHKHWKFFPFLFHHQANESEWASEQASGGIEGTTRKCTQQQ